MVKFKTWNCNLTWSVYRNKQPALQLVDAYTDEPIATASVSLDVPLEPDEILIKDWSENEGMLLSLEQAGIIEDTGKRIPSGFVQAAVCKILKRQ
jgi:hypothetical protein